MIAVPRLRSRIQRVLDSGGRHRTGDQQVDDVCDFRAVAGVEYDSSDQSPVFELVVIDLGGDGGIRGTQLTVGVRPWAPAEGRLTKPGVEMGEERENPVLRRIGSCYLSLEHRHQAIVPSPQEGNDQLVLAREELIDAS